MFRFVIYHILFTAVIGYHYKLFEPRILNQKFSYLQGLTCNDKSLVFGTNIGSIQRAGNNERGELELMESISVSKRNIRKIHANDELIIARVDTDDFENRPFGESVIIGCDHDHMKTLFRLSHNYDYGHVVFDGIIGQMTYLTMYGKKVRKSICNVSLGPVQLEDRVFEITNLNLDESIYLASYTDKRLYVITSSFRFGWLDEDKYAFHEMYRIPFLGMMTAMHVKQLREDAMFVYIGTSVGMVYFLQFNGLECVIRNQIQISIGSFPITQISSTHGNTVYAGTTDCRIVGFNMISFDIVFHVKTGYDEFHCDIDNFIVKSNSIITYNNKRQIVCFIL